MCRSVPQTLATRTLTSTSRSPKLGTLMSSRMSAPGAALAFTTAVIVVLAMSGWLVGALRTFDSTREREVASLWSLVAGKDAAQAVLLATSGLIAAGRGARPQPRAGCSYR